MKPLAPAEPKAVEHLIEQANLSRDNLTKKNLIDKTCSFSLSLSLSDTQSLSNTHNWWECELNFLESSNWIQYRNIKDWKKTFPFSLDLVAVVVVSDSKNSLQMVPSKLVPNKIILIKIIYLPSRT